jgi:hypothetical protein
VWNPPPLDDLQTFLDEPFNLDEREEVTLSLLSDRGQEGGDFKTARKTHGKGVRARPQPQPVKVKPTTKASR